MLSIANKSILLSVVILGVVVPSVVAPRCSSLFPGLEEDENQFFYLSFSNADVQKLQEQLNDIKEQVRA